MPKASFVKSRRLRPILQHASQLDFPALLWCGRPPPRHDQAHLKGLKVHELLQHVSAWEESTSGTQVLFFLEFACHRSKRTRGKKIELQKRHVAALVRSHMNGLKPFERTIEQITEAMPPSPKTITTAAMTANRITSLRELLHYPDAKTKYSNNSSVSIRFFFWYRNARLIGLERDTSPCHL